VALQEPAMDEHRIHPRLRTLKSGKIVFNQKSSVLDCTIRNLSRSGACLQVADPKGVPQSFDLLVEGVSRTCQISWRSGTRIGVIFQ
jgi:hypothetical protein